MLSYQPPFMDVGNLTLFTDDSDKETFYYINIQPSIVQRSGRPAIHAYALLPEHSAGTDPDSTMDTSLSLEISLRVSEEQLEKAREEIKEKWGRTAKRLVPATITDGKVYMILAAAGEDPDPKDWYVTSGSTPSIFGDNRAALVAKTQGDEAKRMIAALNEGQIAGHVYYELNMLGVAPTFKAKMRVHWERVYQHFEEMKVRNLIFHRKEISKTLDDLKESSLVEMDIQELDPEVREHASKALLDELKTEAVKRLFKPSVPPLSASKKIENRIAQGLGMVHATLIPGSHYILRNNKEIQTTDLQVNLQERKVKKYPFYPQALLSSMIRDIGGIKDYLTWIRLDQLPFRTETITLDIASDVTKMVNIKSIKIQCEVHNVSQNNREQVHTFVYNDSETLQSKFTFTKKTTDVYEYRYRGTIYLDHTGTGLPPSLEIDWLTSTAEFIYFNPADYFETTSVSVATDDQSLFSHAHLVETTITAIRSDTNAPVLSKTFVLKESEQEENYSVTVMHSKQHPIQIDLEVIYYIKGQEEYKVKYPDHKDFSFFIPNPFENKWSVELITKADWEKTFKIVTEVRVWDVSREQFLNENFTFTKEHTAQTLSLVTSLETPKNRLAYRSTVIDLDGSIARGAWKEYDGTILVVKDVVKAERTLFFELDKAPDLEDYNIKEIAVAVRYQDENNTIDISSETHGKLIFDEVGDTVSFTHPMPDPSQLEYSYRVKVRSHQGKRYKSDWLTGKDERVLLTVPNSIW